jgi:hypothetical protein
MRLSTAKYIFPLPDAFFPCEYYCSNDKCIGPVLFQVINALEETCKLMSWFWRRFNYSTFALKSFLCFETNFPYSFLSPIWT